MLLVVRCVNLLQPNSTPITGDRSRQRGKYLINAYQSYLLLLYQAALRLRATQLQVPQVHLIELQSVHTEKSTEPK